MTRVPEHVQRELDNCGLPYRIELGSKHQKIFICDRMCGVFARNSRKSSNAGRGSLAIISQIRRMVREIRENKETIV